MRILVAYRFDCESPLLGYHYVNALRQFGHQVGLFDTSERSAVKKYRFKPVDLMLSNLRITRNDPLGRQSRYRFYRWRNRLFKKKVEE